MNLDVASRVARQTLGPVGALRVREGQRQVGFVEGDEFVPMGSGATWEEAFDNAKSGNREARLRMLRARLRARM